MAVTKSEAGRVRWMALRVDPALVEALDRLAARQDRTRRAVVVRALNGYLADCGMAVVRADDVANDDDTPTAGVLTTDRRVDW